MAGIPKTDFPEFPPFPTAKRKMFFTDAYQDATNLFSVVNAEGFEKVDLNLVTCALIPVRSTKVFKVPDRFIGDLVG